MRVFLACTRKLTDQQVTKAKADLSSLFAGVPDVEIVDSGEEYHRSFHIAGGWEEWMTRIASGLDYSTRKPNFNVFAVVEKTLGRATASILTKAIQTQKPVMYLSNDQFWRVEEVVTVDENDWQNGWELRFL